MEAEDQSDLLIKLFTNITSQIQHVGVQVHEDNLYYNDNNNAWSYILFILLVFAGSFTALMCNYFKK